CPENPIGAISHEVDQTNRIGIGNWRCTADDYGVTPSVATLIEPDSNAARLDIHEIRHAISVYIAEKQTLWIETDARESLPVRNSDTTLHRHAFSPDAMSHVGPVVDAAGGYKDYVLKPIAGHVCELHSWIAEPNIRESVEIATSTCLDAIPS